MEVINTELQIVDFSRDSCRGGSLIVSIIFNSSMKIKVSETKVGNVMKFRNKQK